VAVISHRLWRSRFRGDPAVIGKILRVNQRELTVVGVAPPAFRGTMPGLALDIWVPLTMGKELGMLGDSSLRSRTSRGLYALVRLRPGVDIAQARAEAVTFSRSLTAAFPKTNLGITATILPVWEFHSAAPGLLMRPLRILMVISVLLLLIVCANVTNLLLARSTARRKELSIRRAADGILDGRCAARSRAQDQRPHCAWLFSRRTGAGFYHPDLHLGGTTLRSPAGPVLVPLRCE
jgi:hypothetical protein